MTNILDAVARTRREFRPETVQEFFALQLARKLNDISSVRSYVEFCGRYSEDDLLTVYRRAQENSSGMSMADRFRFELRRWSDQKERDDDDDSDFSGI